MKKTMLLSCLVFISLKSNSQSWQQLTLGVDDEVYAICHYNNLLIAGGSFLNTSGVPSNRIAAWNGVIWSSLGSGMNNKVYALCVYAGQLYAGGNFTIAGGVPCSRIARWDGIAWSPVGLGMNEQVNCLYVWNGNLYAGGDFTNAGGTTCNRVAKWDGVSWSSLGTGANDVVYDINEYVGNLSVGGYFNDLMGTAICNGIGLWDGTSSYSLSGGVTAGPRQIRAVTNDVVNLYIGGEFNTVGFTTVEKVGRWDGTNWFNLCPGFSNGIIESLLSYNGNIYAGGSFSFLDGVNSNNISVWNGTNWSTVSGGVNSQVNVVYEHNDTIYIGGGFTNSGITPLNHIAYLVPTSLPVSLGTLKAFCDKKHQWIKLSWMTYSEHENYGFYVERSLDGLNWESLDFIEGGVTVNTVSNYEYLDTDFSESVLYYRLRQVDTNGDFEFSKIVSVNCTKSKAEVFPTLASDLVDLQISHEYRLYDMTGKLIREEKSSKILFQDLSSGMYILEILDSAPVLRVKIIKN
jgi:hypothetical protein